MIVGNLAALRQRNIKRMLGYSAVAQMGYVVMALLVGTGDGYAAAVFYLVVYSSMNLAAFGAISALAADDPAALIDDLSGMGYDAPFRSAVLTVALLSLAGIPPTAGFTGKFALFRAAVAGGETGLAVAGLLTAAASVYYYLRVVVALYMRSSPGKSPTPAVTPAPMISLAIAAALLIHLGIWPGALLGIIATILR
jgi:NADH-quinone oxidoreductase subunit N